MLGVDDVKTDSRMHARIPLHDEDDAHTTTCTIIIYCYVYVVLYIIILFPLLPSSSRPTCLWTFSPCLWGTHTSYVRAAQAVVFFIFGFSLPRWCVNRTHQIEVYHYVQRWPLEYKLLYCTCIYLFGTMAPSNAMVSSYPTLYIHNTLQQRFDSSADRTSSWKRILLM